MKSRVCCFCFAAALLFTFPITGRAQASPTPNEKLVQKLMTELFINRDVAAAAPYFGEPYIQHNPAIGDGHGSLGGIIKALPANFKYEPGMIVGHGDIVMIHGRYTGWGPKPMVVVDIFRVKNGKVVEHWDVMQDEVPADQTKSGHPMFTPGER
jgi:predicted SnoaL-like aldol condensation-catalyzing enzyme